MPDPLKDLTRVLRDSFKTMRLQAEADKVRFGDWINRLAGAMRPHLLGLFMASLTRNRGKVEKGEADSYAIERAMFVARSVTQTSTEWLENGRDPRDVFSVDRAVHIAMTEASTMINHAKATAIAGRGKKLKWVLGGKACDQCKSLAGKIVKPGKQFVSKNGTAVFAPPLHPSCRCTVVEAR